MHKANNLIWIAISLVALVTYTLLIYKYFSPEQLHVDKDYMYSLWVPITLVIPLLFRKYNYYKLAFLIFLFETIVTVLSPICYFEEETIFTITVLWIPSVGIGLWMARMTLFRNKWIATLVSIVFTYTLFPASNILGQILLIHFDYVVQLCP